MQQPGTGTPARLDDADSQAPAIRASDRERDAATQRLQQAFAEGRLDDGEFDQRMRTALSARTRPELDQLLTDLPAPSPAAGPPGPARPPGRLAVSFKSSVRRAGRWRVPERYRTVVYKGSGWLDLRAAELTAAETTLLAVAYKSRITILVPPGLRVEAGGFGADTDTEAGPALPADAPVLHVRGFAYKGTIRVRNRPPEDSGLPSPGSRGRAGVDGARAQWGAGGVLLQAVGEPARRAGDGEDRLTGPGDHPRAAGQHGQGEVDVRLGQRAPVRLGQHGVGHRQPGTPDGPPDHGQQQPGPRVAGR